MWFTEPCFNHWGAPRAPRWARFVWQARLCRLVCTNSLLALLHQNTLYTLPCRAFGLIFTPCPPPPPPPPPLPAPPLTITTSQDSRNHLSRAWMHLALSVELRVCLFRSVFHYSLCPSVSLCLFLFSVSLCLSICLCLSLPISFPPLCFYSLSVSLCVSLYV